MFETARIDHSATPARDSSATLSPREREVLELLAEGSTNRDVAKRLYLSEETVKSHVRSSMLKLEARTRTHAVVLALRAGIIAARAKPEA